MDETAQNPPPVRWLKVLDQTKCIGCHACTTACKSENEVPLGVTRTFVKSADVGVFPQVRRTFQVTRCNQCTDAPCVNACPTGSMFKRDDGIVDFDKEICIGCKACMAACPYDAIFINPEDHSAEKCNMCAHRLDVGLEPACVTVCPTEAILVGDLNDPESEVAKIVQRKPVQVRRPEKETGPGVFYLGAHQATLDPLGAARPTGGLYAWSTQGAPDPQLVTGGHPEGARSSAAAVISYDIPHYAPWGWRVSAYTWTKSISAGALIVAVALAYLGRLDWGSTVVRWVAPLIALAFLGITGVLLIWDLKHPFRFYLIFTRHQWRSWLVRGSFIISGYGAAGAAYFVAALVGSDRGEQVIGGVAIALAVGTACYTAFLFAQAKARDLWQSPLLPAHLAVQAVLAGAAALLPFATGSDPLRVTLAVAAAAHLLLVLGEVTLPHVTAHARLASHEMTGGRFRNFFRVGVARCPRRGRRAVDRGGRRTVRAARAPCTRARLRPGRTGGATRMTGPNTDLDAVARRVSAARQATEERGETFYAGPSKVHLAAFPPKERWDEWVELDSRSWPRRVEKRYMLVPTTCFNCESACGLLAYVDRDDLHVRKFEGNPEHPGSRGRNCAKGPATINQVTDPDRILYPLKRVGARGEGKWERISWDEAMDALAARIRKAIQEQRHNEIMIHIGRPGEDGFTERVLASWGVDGHNSHTNVCSSGGRTGYQFWMGADRPSPDHANAKVIYLISSHLEAGHYFNPHAQRITEARARGAKVIVLDTRLSNTATHADYWLSPQPGSEAAINLAIARHLIVNRLYDAEFVRQWWNWSEYLEACRPDLPQTFAAFEDELARIYDEFTFDYAAAESGIPARTLEEVAEVVATAGSAFSSHSWRSAAASNLGGWQVSRTLTLISALLGAIGAPGGLFPNSWNKFVPKPIHTPPHPKVWQDLSWPLEYPLSQNEMSFLLPHLLKDGRGKLDTYFIRVYNPVWTNPDGMSWMEVLTDEDKVGCFVALTPTWNESAYLADYVLPVGHSSERHDTHSYEQYDGQWLGFRQPVLRAARERLGETITDTRDVNPGEVWEENELYIDLSWRIDPDGSLGIRQHHESRLEPGTKLTVDEYYGWMFANSVPGLPERAAEEGLSPLEFMRRYGAFEIARGLGRQHTAEVPAAELDDVHTSPHGRVYTATPKPAGPNVVPMGAPEPDADGRRAVGVEVDGVVLRGFPTPSGKLEFWSSTLASWGWPEHALPGYIKSHVHPEKLAADQLVLLSTFRLPTQIHTRSANSKWLDELAHTNPVWIHPSDASRLGVRQTGDLVRVSTDIGFFVAKAWVTEGIRPGVVACSHHMGRWRTAHQAGRVGAAMATVDLQRDGADWSLHKTANVAPYESTDPDTQRIWWSDTGVHQNLTFPVHPDPISGMHCWHQAVRVTLAQAGDAHGDVSVDTERARQVYREWLAMTRPAAEVTPDGLRRPMWLMRPLKPGRDQFIVPASS